MDTANTLFTFFSLSTFLAAAAFVEIRARRRARKRREDQAWAEVVRRLNKRKAARL